MTARARRRSARATDLDAAWRGGRRTRPAILEAFVPFAREVSVIAARGADGDVRRLRPRRERPPRPHPRAPPPCPPTCRPRWPTRRRAIARRDRRRRSTMSACSRSRCSCCRGGRRSRLLVNEIAPRVHNSGHWTHRRLRVRSSSSTCAPSAACRSARPRRLGRVGDGQSDRRRGRELARAAGRARRRAAPLRQAQARPGRKMGHVTRLEPLF